MFGTGRKISQIELHVHKLENANERERCVTWGCVSYTDDLDYPKVTTEDCLIFMMYVSAKRFAAYAEKISTSSVNKAGLQVTGVTGFYSDWSPDIYTDHVKVLTGGDEHKVHTPENCGITPPRLDNVFEAQLYFESTCKFGEAPDTSNDEEPSDDEEESRPEPHETRYQTPSFEGLNAAVAKGTKLLSSLRTAAWIICILLIILIFKQ